METVVNTRAKGGLKTGRRKEIAQCYLMLSTQIIGFFTFTLYPILWALRWAWYSYNRVPSTTRFVGWDNFVKLFTQDSAYWTAWITTIQFTLLKMPIELPLAMFLALLLNQKRLSMKGFYRSMYYMPCVVSVAIIGLIFSNMFDYFGIINAILVDKGFIKENIDWFTTKGTAMAVLVIGAVWNTFGTNVMYFVAALTNVPDELYECARLDGASPWTVFWKITLPMIAPVLQTILMLSLVGTLKVGDYVLVLTNGAPGGRTHTVMSYMVRQFTPGFVETTTPAIGYGCALSIVTAIILATVSILYNVLSSKMNSTH